MKYYKLEAEVAGGFGDNAVLADPHARPPVVTRFHYEFFGWSGDPLLEVVACFIVLESLKESILALQATGVTFGQVEVTTTEQLEELYPGVKLPKFVWLQVSGKAGKDDFGLSSDHCLVVSQRILDLLKEAGMSQCDIKEFAATAT